MKISDAITKLQQIQKTYGDINIIGAAMSEDQPLRNIVVLDSKSVEIKTYNVGIDVSGVFLEG